jgi:hypothetical protein
MAKKKEKEAEAGAATPPASAEQNDSQRANKAQKLFARYPGTERFYFTSDDQAFLIENDARNHAATLKDKTVETISNGKINH